MDLIDQLKQFSERVSKIKDALQTEEATKMSLIVPFFQLLGYDVFNPDEFTPEYTADVGIKKGEKVDYAIIKEKQPVILIEAKWCGETLERHSSQLFRYFSTTPAKFAILTNGLTYQFYTDLDESNKMDLVPFLEIDILNIKNSYINELKKFTKSSFDVDNIFSTASELKYSKAIKQLLSQLLKEPTDEFIRYVLSDIYTGIKTQNVIDKFRSIVKKSFNDFISETMNEKITSALKTEQVEEQKNIEEEVAITEEEAPKIVTTAEEIESYYIIKSLLMDTIRIDDISYKDNERYFAIIYKGNIRKTICRINLDAKKKQLWLPDENKAFTKYYLDSINSLYNYKEQLTEVVKRYLED